MANDSVHVFRAQDFEEALSRAIEIGRQHEEEYRNENEQPVRWKIAEVVTLDSVGASIDGAEVYSEFEEFEPPREMRLDEVFSPESSQPKQTF